MSFILDALRKVEDEKRRGPGSQSTEPSMDGARGLGRRRQSMLMGAIALASAVVTAVVLSLFMLGGEPGKNGLNGSTSESVSASRLPEPRATLPLANGDDELELLPPLPQPEPEPPPEPGPETIVEASSASASAAAALGETPAAEAPPPEPEPAAPIRVVGRERTARVDFAPPFDADEAEEPPEPEMELVESDVAIPSLVLQGTSVIDGNPVAVISDQRVFEGDLIEGARVVRIGEREVELELEGKRFVLRL